jgi:hypothetical protein
MVRLEPKLKQRLREHAARQGCSMSKVVADLVSAHFDLVDAFERADTPKEARNMAIITGEHQGLVDDIAFTERLDNDDV